MCGSNLNKSQVIYVNKQSAHGQVRNVRRCGCVTSLFKASHPLTHSQLPVGSNSAPTVCVSVCMKSRKCVCLSVS